MSSVATEEEEVKSFVIHYTDLMPSYVCEGLVVGTKVSGVCVWVGGVITNIILSPSERFCIERWAAKSLQFTVSLIVEGSVVDTVCINHNCNYGV